MNTLLGDPREYEVKPTYAPGPTGARALAMLPEAMGGGPEVGSPGAALTGAQTGASPSITPAAALTAPQATPQAGTQSQKKSGFPAWVRPQDQAFYEQARNAGRNYRRAVEQRRQGRRQLSAYGKLKNQLDREMSTANDLRSIVETYKDLFYEGDAPNAQHMAVLRSAAKHVTAAERLREQEQAMRKKLTAQGIKIPDEGDFDPDAAMEANDQPFDEMIRDGYATGMAIMP